MAYSGTYCSFLGGFSAARIQQEFPYIHICQPSANSGTSIANDLFPGAWAVNFGNITHPTVDTANFYTQWPYLNIQSGTTGDNYAVLYSQLGTVGQGIVCRGANPGEGGFLSQFRFSLNTAAANGSSGFVGNGAPSGGGTTTPSTRNHHIGISYDPTDDPATSPNWYLTRRAGSGGTRVALGAGAPRDSTTVFDLFLFCPPNGSYVGVKLVNLTTRSLVLDSIYTTDIPDAAELLVSETYTRNGTSGVDQGVRIYLVKHLFGTASL